jgi:threonine-phosphate decarboxylase
LLSEIKDLKIFPSETSFLLVKLLTPKITSTILREELAKEGLLIRDCSTFLGLDNSYFRLTVRSEADNQKLATALKKVMRKTN